MDKVLILLLGSYVGQDSYGDKFLLRTVVSQFQHHLGATSVKFISHLTNYAALDKSRVPSIPGVIHKEGVATILMPWQNRFQHYGLPSGLAALVATFMLPFYILAKKKNRTIIKEIWHDIGEASTLYFYGGTQLVDKWFWMNFGSIAITLAMCRLRGVPVFWGPQQYGPQNIFQNILMRLIQRGCIEDIRTRNKNDLKLLRLPEHALQLDEIFSCSVRYPISEVALRRREYVMLNMRGEAFFFRDGRGQGSDENKQLVEMLQTLQHQLGLPYKVFQMSGPTFSDDTKIVDLLEHYKIEYSLADVGDDDLSIIKLAQDAYGMVSMSFHGCVLGMIGGCPSIPITAGTYYNYKYDDFSRYVGQDTVPIVFLQQMNPVGEAEKISRYFDTYDAQRVALVRESASISAGEWYASVVQRVCHSQA